MSTPAKTSPPPDRSSVPAAGSPRAFSFPNVTSVKLSNGLRVLSVHLPELPLVTAEILMPAGGHSNPLDRAGLADVHGSLLEEGTENFSSSELALAIEQLGGSLDTGAGWNVTFAEVNLLSSSFDHGLNLLSEVVLKPTFPAEQFEWFKERSLADLLRRPSRPRLLADDVFARVVYEGSVYGVPVKGTHDGVSGVTVEEVKDFHRRFAVPGGSTLLVAGDFDPSALHERAEDLFGGWAPRPSIELPMIEPAARQGIEVHIADREGAAQTQIQIGHAGVDRRHPDFFVLIALNVLLGGKFTSRLNLNLRERHGFTYGVQSSFARRLGPGPFTVRTAVATDVAGAAVREILYELNRLCQEPIPSEELQDTLDYLLGVFPYTVQTTEDISSRLENLAIYDLPLDYYDSFPLQLKSLTSADLEAAARKFLHPDQLVIVAVGPVEELKTQLESYGPIQVHSS